MMSCSRCLLGGSVVVALLAGRALAGPTLPQFSMNVSFNAQVIKFAPADPASYSLFASAYVTGFTEPTHADNRVFITSNNGHFTGETTPTTSSSSSTGFLAFNGLYDAITDGAGWNVQVTDGATGTFYDYAFGLDGMALTADHMRPTTVTNVSPGDVISSTPTFDWSVDPAANPDAEYQYPTAYLLGSSSYFTPPVNPGESSWTPDGPLDPGLYTLIVSLLGTSPTGPLLIPTTPTPLNGAAELVGFGFSDIFTSYAQVNDLTVIPAPGTLALAGVAGVVGLRRRR